MIATGTDNELYRTAIPLLDGRGGAHEPDWLRSIRETARERFRAFGLPSAKDEAWRFTPLRNVTKIALSDGATRAPSDGSMSDVPDLGGIRIDFVDGRPSLDPTKAPPGVRVVSLAEAMRQNGSWLEPHLARLAATDDGFVALNTALFEDGLAILVERNARVESPIHVVHAPGSVASPRLDSPRLLVVVESGAEATLVETVNGQGAPASSLSNGVTEISVGENARLSHVRIAQGAPDRFVVAAVRVRQRRDSRYASHVFSFGGALSRHALSVALVGPGAECTLDGLYLAQSGDFVDHHTTVVHEEGHALSRQKYKGLLDGTGRGVFDGTVIVRRDAQRTEAHQENKNLLLSNEAAVHAKPHLEIDADDVKCSHGATVGRLDQNQLFYLRTRGIDLPTARAALSYAFAAELTERLASESLRRYLEEAVLSWLTHGKLVRELLA